MVTRRHFQPLAGGFASILLPFTVWVALVILTGFLAGCGALRQKLLNEGDAIPLDYVEENFGIARSASDLVDSPFRLIESHLVQAQSCYGEDSSAGFLLSSAREADNRLRDDVAVLAPLPSPLPPFPSDTVLRRERENFVLARKKPTERATAHEVAQDSALFARVRGPTRTAPERLSARWRSRLKREGVQLKKAEVRSFYARSLEPDNEFQFLVQCAALEATLPSGGAARTVWPLYAALESGTLGESATQTFSLRGDILPVLGDAGTVGFTFLTPETMGRVALRSQSDAMNVLRLKFHALSRDENDKERRLAGVAFREGRSFHFTRFLAREASTVPGEEGVREAFLSFQNGLTKAAWESWSPLSEASRRAFPSQSPQMRFLDSACAATTPDEYKEFQQGGIHAINPSAAKTNVAALAAFTDAFPASQVAVVCADLLPAANESLSKLP
ncbi:MAG: hypothetical protein IOD12_18155 [Silvanigrellales bacterium]|nr:hypothetical protein [Silvanigrellales bacterium]